MTERRKLPSQVPFIIGNEACERFSSYGMRNILTVFLIEYLLVNEVPDSGARTALAKSHFHDFVVAVYLFPLIGGWLADRYWGRYRTILWLSLVYCLGNLCLALFVTNAYGFYLGLSLIAMGSGGIKPCVGAMVGDQFTADTKDQASRVFQAFYWSINLGSFFASALIPKLLKADWAGPRVAFGIPGALMLVATLIFWLGRSRYVIVPPTGARPHGFLQVVRARLRHGSWQGARVLHPDEAVEGTRSVLKVLLVFAPIPLFWALFDQKASTWVVQAKAMNGHIDFLGIDFEPSQMQLVNPALVMLLIPFMGAVGYPWLKRTGFEMTPLRRMTVGMFIAASSWVAAGLVQQPIDCGERLSILWQLGPYVLLTLSEVMVSTSGLEFAYSQAPVEMKGTLMSFWLLTTAIGNLVVARASTWLTLSGAPLFFAYAAAAAVAAVALAFIARRYVMVDRYLAGPVSG
jgi:POT family proton-dependent oligopeptide transporter